MEVNYSKKPLAEKLNLKSNTKAIFLNAPSGYIFALKKSVLNLNVVRNQKEKLDFIQLFITQEEELIKIFPKLKELLKKDGAFWVAWPKQAAKLKTDLDENKVMEIGLKNGLVDVKVVSINETWSGLKFVYRLKDGGE